MQNNLTLRFNSYAWAKMLFMRDVGETEVSGWGISDPDNANLIVDFILVPQVATVATTDMDDDGLALYLDTQVFDNKLQPWQCMRVWIHFHPGNSAHPSSQDEETYKKHFETQDYGIMYILAIGGASYCRAKVNHPHLKSFDQEIKAGLDSTFYSKGWDKSVEDEWVKEYTENVSLPLKSVHKPWLQSPKDKYVHSSISHNKKGFLDSITIDRVVYSIADIKPITDYKKLDIKSITSNLGFYKGVMLNNQKGLSWSKMGKRDPFADFTNPTIHNLVGYSRVTYGVPEALRSVLNFLSTDKAGEFLESYTNLKMTISNVRDEVVSKCVDSMNDLKNQDYASDEIAEWYDYNDETFTPLMYESYFGSGALGIGY